MRSAYETLKVAQALGIAITLEAGQLRVASPPGMLTLELKHDLKAHKADILYLLSLPEPAKPGPELEQLRREIGEMAREQAKAGQVGA